MLLMVPRALMLVVMMLAVPVLAAERRGSVAFHYGGALTAKQLAFFGRFDVLVTHDPLPREQVRALNKAGTRLALYEWSVAFYRTLVRKGTWQERLLRGDRKTLLNRRPLHGHAGAEDADAFYFDPANDQQNEQRVRAIGKRLKAVGYDGVFLDTTTFESVHPDALDEFRKRYPELLYDVAFARFLALLRKELTLIITNQGYRAAEHYLPYADYDVTESLLSRPWHDPENRWNSVSFLMPQLILPAAERHPHVGFVHLNYDPAQVERTIATARLFGHEAYVATADINRTVYSDLYFLDLGAPAGDIRRDGLTATRAFQHGTIVVSPDRAKIERALP
ncbi:MAG TPA: hypothetical protein VE010_15745 [Thermoanaerobaculia bacterium]|nr:hypothetical protein [Thermoanaerobaculia bacterium]